MRTQNFKIAHRLVDSELESKKWHLDVLAVSCNIVQLSRRGFSEFWGGNRGRGCTIKGRLGFAKDECLIDEYILKEANKIVDQ